MSITPKNPWVAKVHASMLASGETVACREIVATFGQPPGDRLASLVLGSAATNGWFKAVGRRRATGARSAWTENLYVAVKRRPTHKQAPPMADSAPRPSSKGPFRFSSVWDFAAGVPAQIQARSGISVSTRLSPLAQWVSA